MRKNTPGLAGTERDLLLGQLARQHAADQFLLFAYVIMPTHLHLLVAPKRIGLIEIMREFKSRTAQQMAVLRGTSTSIWQPRFFDYVLRRVGDFWDKLEYIHQNPVEARLTKKAEAWAWSSAMHYARVKAAPVSIDPIELPADRHVWLRTWT